MKVAERRKLDKIPSKIDNNEILHLINDASGESGYYFRILKDITNTDDEELSHWLHISEKTFRNYKKSNTETKASLMEHVIMITALFKHGLKIFGDANRFMGWLKKENIHFNAKPPIDFIVTISGLKFIDDRLTGMEYGDNA